MLNARENVMAILNGEQPDAYTGILEYGTFIDDPQCVADTCPADGEPHPDSWGVQRVWLPGAPGPHPVITDENKVVKDIEDWERYVVPPDLSTYDWSIAEKAADAIDRSNQFAVFYCSTGLFERSHFLMGMEDAFCAYMENEDEMKELLRVIADHKIALIKEMAYRTHPDMIFYHDDWGSKQNLFLPPTTWREIIKPLQQEISDTIHDCGMLYLHHADCVCEPIVEDMAEIGIDVWTDVIPQNDIVGIKDRLKGSMCLNGCLDNTYIVTDLDTEDEIRAFVRESLDKYLPGGYLFPAVNPGALADPWKRDIANDEIQKYGRIWASEHPVA